MWNYAHKKRLVSNLNYNKKNQPQPNKLTASVKMGKTPPMSILIYDIKPSFDEALVFELSGIWSATLLPMFAGPFRPGGIAQDWVLSISHVELFDI